MQSDVRESVIVSKRWTPDHLDVTFVPMTYARPRRSWLEGVRAHRAHLCDDHGARMMRRRASDQAVVPLADITGAPAYAAPADAPFSASLRDGARRMLRALRHSGVRAAAG